MNPLGDAPNDDKMLSVFFPYALQKMQEVGAGEGTQFAYYTTAKVAMSILTKKEFWMRNANAMNDYMEVKYGLECLSQVSTTNAYGTFKSALNSAHPNLSDELDTHFGSWVPSILSDTYVTSLSAHTPSDNNGRLSMWRAYGGKTGVAIVIDGKVVLSQKNSVSLHAGPVMYVTPEEFGAYFQQMADRMVRERSYLKTWKRDELRNIAFTILRSAMLFTKHPGFKEEQEWRVMACPSMFDSPMLKPCVEDVHGTPQIVQKVKLADDTGVVGLAIPTLIDRIIIGPCDFPDLITPALRQLLGEAGVSNPAERVWASRIPLRHI
jgi:hypothetical protein